MARYEKRKRLGWVFYHENTAVLEAMDPAECKAVILALNAYSSALSDGDAELDVSAIPSVLGKAFCRMIAERVKQDAEAYTQRCEQNSANRKKQTSTVVDDGEQPSTECNNGRPINKIKQKQAKPKEAEGNQDDEASAPIIGFDGTDLTDDMENCARADELVQRYKMPDTDQSREALLEDAAQIGWGVVEAALKKASLSNARQMVSVNFYRRFLVDTGQVAKRGDSLFDYY